MASQITETIGFRSFELVRDQIGAILSDELPSQSTKNTDTRLNAEVFVERFRPVENQELKDKSLVVVELAQGDYDMKTILSQDGMYTFNIDCYESGTSGATTRGDKTASVRLQRLMGVIQGILSHPNYATLGLQSPFIEHTEVSGFKISDPTGKNDASAMMIGRMEFKVRVPDKLTGDTPVPIDGYTTQALLGMTALGYTYGTQSLPPVSPVCPGVVIELNGVNVVNAESGADVDIPVKDTTGAVVGSYIGGEWIVPANVLDDYDLTINGSAFGTINSNTDIPVKDTGGTAVGSKVGVEWIVPGVAPVLNSSELTKSGATVSYQTGDDGDKEFGSGTDFYTLDGIASDWPHNSLERFTDDQLTQVYASDVMIDWSKYNQPGGTVTGFFRTPLVGANLTNQLNGQPYTKNSLSDWWVSNPKQVTDLFNYSVTRNYLNWSPLNVDTSVTADRLWTSLRESATVGIWYGGFTVSVASQGTIYRALLTRTYTLAELGL